MFNIPDFLVLISEQEDLVFSTIWLVSTKPTNHYLKFPHLSIFVLSQLGYKFKILLFLLHTLKIILLKNIKSLGKLQ